MTEKEPFSEKYKARALACINALEGCEDPTMFVLHAKMLLEAAIVAGFSVQKIEELMPALAWLREDKKDD